MLHFKSCGSFRFVSAMSLGVIGKHVVRWTETCITVSTTCSATYDPMAEATEDVLHLTHTNALRPISRPRCRHTIPRNDPRLFRDHNSRHRRVPTHSHCAILCLGVSTRSFVFRPNWLNLGVRQKRHNGGSRRRWHPRC